jgi:hypothetical protein
MTTDSSGGFGRVHSTARWLLTPVRTEGAGITPQVGIEGSRAAIQQKREADIAHLVPEVTRTYPQIIETFRDGDAPTPVITSGRDSSKHKAGSRHYTNQAIDLRCNNIPDEHCRRLSDALQKSLGPDYDIQFEKFPKDPRRDHIHLEYDPKPKRSVAPQSELDVRDDLPLPDWMAVRNRQIGRG